MASNTSEREPIDCLADEFMARYRNGDRPQLSEYTRQYPELADEIESLFPTLIMMEMAGSDMGWEKANPKGLETNGRIPEQLGDYRLLREIGRGGMGIVYEAEQVSLGRHVALKVLPGHAHLETRQLARFQREAQAAAALHHNHIVPVYGTGEQDGILFYAMQYIHGLGLDDVLSELRHSRWEVQNSGTDTKEAASTPNDLSVAIAHNLIYRPAQLDGCAEQPPSKQNGKPGLSGFSQSRRPGEGTNSSRLDSGSEFSAVLLGESEESGRQNANQYFRSVARVGLEVADALAYAHSQGILHRDIKPSNLLLDSDGSVWVADFGLAKADDSDDLTNTGDIVGTIRYMAPERFKGWADPRSDVYSLGLTLYEMLTFRAAFNVNDRAHLLRSVAEASPPRPRRFDRKIPRDLETIVLKATEKEPSQRYSTASALSDDLKRFLEDKPITASRATWGERFRLWCKRSPIVASLAGLVTTLLLMLTVGSVAAAIQFNTQRNEALENLERAEKAERLAQKRLYDSLIAQAETHRHGGQVGQRTKGLQAIRSALKILPELKFSDAEVSTEKLKLRNLAIACLALPDVQPEDSWTLPEGGRACTADDRRERYAYAVPGGEIRIHRIADDEEVLRLPGEGWNVVHGGLMFCRNDQFLCASYTRNRIGRLYVWDLARKTAILKTAEIYDTKCAISPDGGLLAVVGASKNITLFELPSAKLVRKIACRFTPQSVVFGPNSKRIAYASPFQRTMGIVDVETGKLEREIQNTTGTRSLAWQDDRLATGGVDAAIRLWDTKTGEEKALLKGHRAEIAAVAFSKRSDTLVSYAWDTTIRVWNPHREKELLAFPAKPAGRLGLGFTDDKLTYWVSPSQLRTAKVTIPAVRRIRGNQRAWSNSHAVSSDSRFLAVGVGVETDPPKLQIWDLPTGKLVSVMPGLRRGAFLSDGHTLVSSGKQGIESWPVNQQNFPGANEISIGPRKPIASKIPVGTFALDRNEQRVVFQSSYAVGMAHVAAEHNPTYRLLAQKQPFNGVSISPDGKYATAGNFNGSHVRVWEVETSKEVFSIPLRTVRAAFSTDGRWLVTGTNRSFEFRRVGTWKLHHSVPRSWSGSLKGIMAFERTGRMMAISHSIYDTKLIDPKTGKEFTTLTTQEPHTVETLCFSPDGAWLIGTADRLLVWDLRTIRRELDQMGLDWDLPKLPPPSWGAEPKPVKIHWVTEDTTKKKVP